MVSQEVLTIALGCGGWMGVIYSMFILTDGAAMNKEKALKLLLSVPLGGVCSALLTIGLISTWATCVQIVRGMLHPVAFSLYATALCCAFIANELVKEETEPLSDSDSEYGGRSICKRSLASAPRMCE